MIDPSGIPQFTGDFDQLEKDVSGLRGDAIGIRTSGMDVHSRFQMLEAYYTAPEADQLFATTRPVMDNADTFAAQLETVADALDTYAVEARPLAKRLARLKADAFTFADSVQGDDDWTEDEDKVHRDKELRDAVTTTQAAFQDAERRAASTISALVGGPSFVKDDGSHTVNKKTVMYGYDVDDLKHAGALPWGTPEEQTYESWSWGWFEHGAKSFFWDGIYKDGIEAGVSGLWTLFGGNGSDAAGAAWGGLGDVLSGIGQYTITPYDAFMDWAIGPDKESADEVRAKKAAKEFFKGIVAWDQWQENPTRAAGTTVFNVLTLGAGPMATLSKVSEVGAVAKGAGIAAKAGEFIDPIALSLKATGKAVSKLPSLSDLTSRILTTTRPSTETGRVHSVIELDDGSRVIIENGDFVAYDSHGHIVSETPRREGSDAAEGTPEEAAEREPVTVGAAPRASEATAHAGDQLPRPRAALDTPAGHHGGDTSRTVGNTSRQPGASHATGSEAHTTGAHAPGDGHVSAGSSSRGSGDAGPVGEGMAQTPGSSGDAPGRHGETERPSFMREGPNPYGPRGSLTRNQIEEIQVYRANHEPGYFEHYYRKDGTRRLLERYDESGYAPPQLTRPSDGVPLIRAKDAPEPPKPHFLEPDYIAVRSDTVTSKARLRILETAARTRHFAIKWDNLVSNWKAEAGRAHDLHGTIDTAAQWGEARGAYKESHTLMGDRAEDFGEVAAEHHYIAERYPDFISKPLLGPKNGNDQFDQVWQHEDGRIVVIEAKSSPRTELGRRRLPNGRQVSQGSREYFFDILRLMRKRGEHDLVTDLRKALRDGKLEYVVVKGGKNTATYTGYEYRRFDISKGTLP
ncbi:hypothetical protein [Streptomyces sp. NPDC087294]|uniref:hypothetical protein n=1 Tax=Streptomyces sp. NPDC087294 TaxID=3365777 RepID=UPI0038022DEB